MSQCNATSKRTGQRCGAKAMVGSSKCYHHGGVTKRGTASPQFKHGRYSKFLPTRLSGRYWEAQSDPELLALREEIALVDARLADLLLHVDTNEAGWGEIYDVIDQRRKLVLSECHRLVQMQQMISAERAMVLVAALVDVVKSHVKDRATLDAIHDDIGRLIDRQDTTP